MPTEQPIPLQSDTLKTGPSVRTIATTVLIDGVPTPVVMQVLANADADGRILDGETFSQSAMLLGLWRELRAIRQILSAANGFPVPSDSENIPTSF